MTTHTDHPMRHWDRTCPACQEKDKEISQLTAMTKKPTKLMAIPALLEAAGWVRKKEWVGLTDEEIELVSGNYTESEGFKHGAQWALERLKEKNG